MILSLMIAQGASTFQLSSLYLLTTTRMPNLNFLFREHPF
jgi:hypothetical protein